MSTWNSQGWRNKVDEVILEIKKTKFDVTVITEMKEKGQRSEDIDGYFHLYIGVNKDKRAQSGVSILIKKEQRGNLKR